jgi:hypothetical protein
MELRDDHLLRGPRGSRDEIDIGLRTLRRQEPSSTRNSSPNGARSTKVDSSCNHELRHSSHPPGGGAEQAPAVQLHPDALLPTRPRYAKARRHSHTLHDPHHSLRTPRSSQRMLTSI